MGHLELILDDRHVYYIKVCTHTGTTDFFVL